MSLSVYAWISISVFTPILVIFLAYLGFVNHWCAGDEAAEADPTLTQASVEATVASVAVATLPRETPGQKLMPMVMGFLFLAVDMDPDLGSGDPAFLLFIRVDMGLRDLQVQQLPDRLFRGDLHQGAHQHIPRTAHIAFYVYCFHFFSPK